MLHSLHPLQLATLVIDANKAAARNKKILQELRRQVSDIELMLTDQGSDEGKNSSSKKEKIKGRKAQNIDPKLARTIRVRKNVVQALTRKFIETMKEYRSAQQSYKSNMEEVRGKLSEPQEKLRCFVSPFQ